MQDVVWNDDNGPDTDTDSDNDSDTDSDADSDMDSDVDSDSDTSDPCDEPCVRFVDADASGPSDGFSWETAFSTVQEGISSAGACGECQVWITEGVYYSRVSGPHDTIALFSGVSVFGGFDGTENSQDERNWMNNVTILDGRDGPTGTDASYHVVTGSNFAVLDGFTIANGSTAVGFSAPDNTNKGGGMYNEGTSPTVRNCTFLDNYAGRSGGAVYNSGGSNAVFNNCIFANNVTDYDGGGMGCEASTNVTIEDCTFVGNHAGRNGGGVYVGLAALTMKNVILEGNIADQSGGGLGVFNCAPTIENCLFTGNHAEMIGGGTGGSYSSAEFVNCTFHSNSTVEGGGAAGTSDNNFAVFTNCVMWGDTPDELDPLAPAGTVEYSVVQGGFAGVGIINEDPLFEDPASGDFHIQPGSPCIDAAEGTTAPTLDIEGNIRFDDPETPNTGLGPPWADIGAYEYQG